MSACLLIVDDNEMNREVLVRRLTRHGYVCVEATGGREALDMIEQRRFDLALFDIMMPEVSGLDALAKVRETYSLADLPVIMVTAKSQRDDVITALEMGANDYVTKPVDFPVLLARVKTHLELHRLSALKDEFLGIASHDLKNPLTEVLGVASLVEALVPPGTPMPEKLHGLIGSMKKSARRMQTIIEDFLDFQALEGGSLTLTMGPVDLGAIAHEVVDANASYAGQKKVTLHLEADAAPTGLQGDPDRVLQVMQNLVDNALKYGLPDGDCYVRLSAEDGHARVEVQDCGPGLADEDLGRVFDKYVRVGSIPTGGEKSSGLGLNICQQLVELHGGKLGVRNHPGGGAIFWFTLPLGPAA
ncbi:MAG: response regulator receiver sensor signal transduction histidine kinase [Cyanobacteria bacterium RYN_339]|nr:response regulator receiver sensor signal transduction histidine kinase [Cyanobacteria bacterium RYN_339]